MSRALKRKQRPADQQNLSAALTLSNLNSKTQITSSESTAPEPTGFSLKRTVSQYNLRPSNSTTRNASKYNNILRHQEEKTTLPSAIQFRPITESELTERATRTSSTRAIINLEWASPELLKPLFSSWSWWLNDIVQQTLDTAIAIKFNRVCSQHGITSTRELSTALKKQILSVNQLPDKAISEIRLGISDHFLLNLLSLQGLKAIHKMITRESHLRKIAIERSVIGYMELSYQQLYLYSLGVLMLTAELDHTIISNFKSTQLKLLSDVSYQPIRRITDLTVYRAFCNDFLLSSMLLTTVDFSTESWPKQLDIIPQGNMYLMMLFYNLFDLEKDMSSFDAASKRVIYHYWRKFQTLSLNLKICLWYHSSQAHKELSQTPKTAGWKTVHQHFQNTHSRFQTHPEFKQLTSNPHFSTHFLKMKSLLNPDDTQPTEDQTITQTKGIKY